MISPCIPSGNCCSASIWLRLTWSLKQRELWNKMMSTRDKGREDGLRMNNNQGTDHLHQSHKLCSVSTKCMSILGVVSYQSTTHIRSRCFCPLTLIRWTFIPADEDPPVLVVLSAMLCSNNNAISTNLTCICQCQSRTLYQSCTLCQLMPIPDWPNFTLIQVTSIHTFLHESFIVHNNPKV